MPGVFPDYLASVSLFKGLEAGARTPSRSAMMTSGHGDFQVRFVTCITIACAARGHDVPGLKAQDDGQATKTHAEVALGRSDDPRGIGDHRRVRGVDGFRGGVTGYALVDAPAMTQRGPWIRFGARGRYTPSPHTNATQ
jgi:hypothetical protein